MEAFIIDAAEKGSGRIAELADMASRDRESDARSLPAAICLPVRSVLLPTSRAVSDGTGDGAMAAIIVVREVEVTGIRGVACFRFEPTRKISASCYKVRRNGFDSFGTAEISELGGEIEITPSVAEKPICPVCLVVC